MRVVGVAWRYLASPNLANWVQVVFHVKMLMLDRYLAPSDSKVAVFSAVLTRGLPKTFKFIGKVKMQCSKSG